MITPAKMYWITRLDNIHMCACVVVIAVAVAIVVCTIAGFTFLNGLDNDEAIAFRLFRMAKRLFIAAIAFLVALVFVPTTKEMAAIMVVPRLANSETVRELGGRLQELATAWLEELAPKRPEDGKAAAE